MYAPTWLREYGAAIYLGLPLEGMTDLTGQGRCEGKSSRERNMGRNKGRECEYEARKVNILILKSRSK